MKSWKIKIAVTALAVFVGGAAQAAIVVPGADGSDGVLHVTNNITIDLGLATTADWDTPGSGTGVYDANKWAVVFKYSEVIVDSGATVTFKNHPAKAPVVWLVSGDVTINGTVNLNGQGYRSAPGFADPGPGGFRGGMGTYGSGVYASAGFGIGGGQMQSTYGGGGSYSTQASYGPAPYGNPSLIPLVGGSGGGVDQEAAYGGGGGGGAILVACEGNVSVSGSLNASGGAGYINWSGTDRTCGGGSGGGIRIIADSVTGTGQVTAAGGSGYGTGGQGRIRLERVNNSGNLTVVPDPSILGMEAGDTALLWPPEGAPEARIVSVNGVAAPADPRADFGTTFADVALTPTNTAAIVVETTNVEPASQVFVRVTPRHSANYSQYTASLVATNNVDPLVLTWQTNPGINVGYSAVQVRVVRP